MGALGTLKTSKDLVKTLALTMRLYAAANRSSGTIARSFMPAGSYRVEARGTILAGVADVHRR